MVMVDSERKNVSFLKEAITRDLMVGLARFSQNESCSIVIFFQEHILTALKTMINIENVIGAWGYIKGYDTLSEKNPVISADRAVYIMNPYSDYVAQVVKHFHVYHEIFPSSSPMFLCIPETTMMFEQILEQDYGFKDKFPEMIIQSLDIDLSLVDSPFFSMNLPDSFRRIFCDGELSSLRWISRFLCKAQSTWFGPFEDIVCVGPKAKCVGDALEYMEGESCDITRHFISATSKLLIIDRNVDLITPLLTQLTYEGLLDELYGFSLFQKKLPFSFEDSSQGETNYLNCVDDKLFKKIRDKPFSCIGTFLYEQSLMVKQSYDKRKELTQIREIREFVENLSELQETHRLIGIHTSVARNVGKLSQNPMFRKRTLMEQYIIQGINEKDVFEYIHDLINQKSSIILVLRLLCLYSLANGGIRSKEYDGFKEKMMLSFGVCETVAAFLSLSKCGLLKKLKGKPQDIFSLWQKYEMGYRSSGSTLESDVDPISQLFGGYIPPIIRFLEMYFTLGKRKINSFLLEAFQNFSSIVHHRTSSSEGVNQGSESPVSIVICVIGGLTRSEIGGMRILRNKYPNFPLLVFSTEVLSGRRIMNSLGIAED